MVFIFINSFGEANSSKWRQLTLHSEIANGYIYIEGAA